MNSKSCVRYKAAVVGFSYYFGLLLSSYTGYLSSFIISASLAVFSLFAVTAGNRLIFTVLFSAALGFSVYGLCDYFLYSAAAEYDGKTFTVSGEITSVNNIGNDTALYTVKAKVNSITIKIAFFAADCAAEAGDEASFVAVLRTFSDNASFAEYSYNKTEGVLFEATSVKDLAFTSKDRLSLFRFVRGLNKYVGDKVTALLPNDYGALICAVFLGDKSRLSDDLSGNILRAGVSHYTAVSGLHLTIIVSVFLPLTELIRSKHKRKLRFIILLAVILFFTVFFNFSASVLRSGIMLVIFYGGDLFFRKRSSFNSIGFALLLISVFNPTSCRDIGLILSVAGCFGVGVVAPALNSEIFGASRHRFLEFVIAIICAIFFTVPIAGLFFGGFSTVALFSNILLTPFITVLLISVLLFALTGCTFSLFLLAGGLCSKAAVFIINFFAGFKYAYLSLEYDFLLPWIIASSVFISVVYLFGGKLSRTVKSGIVSLAVLVGMITVSDVLVADCVNVRVYSDGTSAAVIIRKKEACVVIVTNDGKNAVTYVKEYLDNRFYGEASVICLLNSAYNSVSLLDELPSLHFVPPSDSREFDVNNSLTLRKDDNSAIVTVGDSTILITPASYAGNADIQILYGYGDSDTAHSGRVVYTDSRMEANGENEINAYYDKTIFYIR